jgi:hypothetical protein
MDRNEAGEIFGAATRAYAVSSSISPLEARQKIAEALKVLDLFRKCPDSEVGTDEWRAYNGFQVPAEEKQ